jgi:hypothetical protein
MRHWAGPALGMVVLALTFAGGFAYALVGLMNGNAFGYRIAPLRVEETCVWNNRINPATGEYWTNVEAGTMGYIRSEPDCDMDTCGREVERKIIIGPLTWVQRFETLPGWRGCVPERESQVIFCASSIMGYQPGKELDEVRAWCRKTWH